MYLDSSPTHEKKSRTLDPTSPIFFRDVGSDVGENFFRDVGSEIWRNPTSSNKNTKDPAKKTFFFVTLDLRSAKKKFFFRDVGFDVGEKIFFS